MESCMLEESREHGAGCLRVGVSRKSNGHVRRGTWRCIGQCTPEMETGEQGAGSRWKRSRSDGEWADVRLGSAVNWRCASKLTTVTSHETCSHHPARPTVSDDSFFFSKRNKLDCLFDDDRTWRAHMWRKRCLSRRRNVGENARSAVLSSASWKRGMHFLKHSSDILGGVKRVDNG